jgi:hypothetical protein
MLVCDENLIRQILQVFCVQNQLCLYMETHEPQFFKSVLLTTSISLYAGSDTREGHCSCMRTCHGHAISTQSYHLTCRLAIKDNVAPAGPCQMLCPSLLALCIKCVDGCP